MHKALRAREREAEIEALRKLRTDGKISGQLVDKILKDNPSAFYGL